MSETLVLKYGGNAMNDSAAANFAQTIAALVATGNRVVVVHGGGPQISQMLDKLGIDSEFRHGLRVTSPAAMQVVQMVLTGQVQREVVAALRSAGVNALGISGEDGLLTARQHRPVIDGQEVDLGLVGEVTAVNPASLNDLLEAGYTPVVSGLGADTTGQIYNVNADISAGAIAGALQADRYIVLTDVDGVYRNWPDRESLIETMSLDDAKALAPTLDAGMLPKMRGCIDAISAGATAGYILNADTNAQTLVSILDGERVGTVITQ
jgi:acetylglutamate kinase